MNTTRLRHGSFDEGAAAHKTDCPIMCAIRITYEGACVYAVC